MTSNDSETSAKRYTLRPTFTPLPNAKKQASGQQSNEAEAQPNKQPKAASIIRAANEDDDLYDPYSDYHDGTLKAAEFEEDPWR